LDLLKHTSEGTPYQDKEEEIGDETGDETFDVNKWASALLSMKPWANGGSPTRRLDGEEEIADGTPRFQSPIASHPTVRKQKFRFKI
jgi:hypothetical protein